MACKRSAVRSRLPPPKLTVKVQSSGCTETKGNMHRIGVISIWLGLIGSVVGLIVGFIQLPSGDEEKIGFWMSLIPVGFALLLLGTVMTQMSKK